MICVRASRVWVSSLVRGMLKWVSKRVVRAGKVVVLKRRRLERVRRWRMLLVEQKVSWGLILKVEWGRGRAYTIVCGSMIRGWLQGIFGGSNAAHQIQR